MLRVAHIVVWAALLCLLNGCTTMFVWYIPEVQVDPVKLVSADADTELDAEGQPDGWLTSWVLFENGDELALETRLTTLKTRAWPLDDEQPEHGALPDEDGWVRTPPLLVSLNPRGTLLLVKTSEQSEATRVRLPRYYGAPPYGASLAWRIPLSLLSVPIDIATFPIQLVINLFHASSEDHEHNEAGEHLHGPGSHAH